MNRYEFTLLRREDGISSQDEGVTLAVVTTDMVRARDKALYQNRQQGWNSVPKLIDVKLDVPEADRGVWYSNEKVGLALRIAD